MTEKQLARRERERNSAIRITRNLIASAVKDGGHNSFHMVSIALQFLGGQCGDAAVAQMIDEFELTKVYGIKPPAPVPA